MARPIPADPAVDSLLAFLDAAPSPYHAAAEAAARLADAGFTERAEDDAWADATGRHLVVRGGTVVAWSCPDPAALAGGFRIVGAHTDSPNLRVKPRPDTGAVGCRQLGVEVYGGALWNSWLDRDLGLSGRVAVRGNDNRAPQTRLVRVDRPLARIPQLAIHLDRGVNENGLKLNPQQHLVPVWGLGAPDEGGLTRFLADELGTSPANVLAWDLMLHEVTPAARLGRDGELVSGARIDNLLSCATAVDALAALPAERDPAAGIAVVCLFDHEEIGSESSSGAASTVLPTVLERIALALGADRAGFLRALAGSTCVSADGAHATHPNYVDRHEPEHRIALGGGPVIKANANVRYATDATTAAAVKLLAERLALPVQEFVVRTDLPCGSTIGPITAARLGIPTVDVGVAQLSMHSARELCGAADVGRFTTLLGAFLAGGA